MFNTFKDSSEIGAKRINLDSFSFSDSLANKHILVTIE